MLFQPIVINQTYFIRHLKRWMICANEISIIYGGHKRTCARARQHKLFRSEPTRKKLIYDLFSSYFMCRRERERGFSLGARGAFRKESEMPKAFVGYAHKSTRAWKSWQGFIALRLPQRVGWTEKVWIRALRTQKCFIRYIQMPLKLSH